MDERLKALKKLSGEKEFEKAKEIIDQIKIEATDRCNHLIIMNDLTLGGITKKCTNREYSFFKCKKGKPLQFPTKWIKEICHDSLHTSAHYLLFGEEPIAPLPARALSILYMLDDMSSGKREQTFESFTSIYKKAKEEGRLTNETDVSQITYKRTLEMMQETDNTALQTYGPDLGSAVRTRVNSIVYLPDEKKPIPRLTTLMFFSYRTNKPADFFVIWDYMKYIKKICYYKPYQIAIHPAFAREDSDEGNLIISSDQKQVAFVRQFTLVSEEDQNAMFEIALKNYLNSIL